MKATNTSVLEDMDAEAAKLHRRGVQLAIPMTILGSTAADDDDDIVAILLGFMYAAASFASAMEMSHDEAIETFELCMTGIEERDND